MQHLKWLASLTVALASAASVSCAEDLDTTRKPVDNGTFGTTVFTLACQRVAYERDLLDGDDKVDVAGNLFRATCRFGDAPPAGAPAAVLAMNEQRPPLILALDTMFPADYLPDLQDYLTSTAFLAMYDDGTMERSLTSLGDFLDLAAEDAKLAPALARLDRRPGYRPLLPALGLVRAVAAYDDLSSLVRDVTDAIAEGGPAHGEFVKFQLALSKELQDATAVPAEDADAPDRTLRLASNLLLGESALLGNGVARPLVLRDARGLALVNVDPATNKVAAPFFDADNDGIAESDADGNYLDVNGQPILATPTPFFTPYSAPDLAVARDVDGRALQAQDGVPLYRYVDLDKTVLAALVRDVPQLFDPLKGTALNFLRGSSALLGPRVIDKVHTYSDGSTIKYRGYDDTQSPLLDIAYGVLTLLTDPSLPDTLAFAKELMANHEAEAARLLESIWVIADVADQFPDAKLEPGSALYDDLMKVVVGDLAATDPKKKFGILNEPKLFQGRTLAEDLLLAMQNPKVRDLGDRFRDYMKYTDKFGFTASAPYDVTGSFSKVVDRSKADSRENRSLFQRLMHLVHDSAGVKMCNKDDAKVKQFGITLATYEECALLEVPDLAVLYVQSIAYARNPDGSFKTDGGNMGNHFMPKATLTFTFNNLLIEAVASDDFIEDQATINGFRRHPTPAALNRVLLLNPAPTFLQDTMDPAIDVDGDKFIDDHSDSIMVWEKNGFYDQIQPIVQAFADHDREDLFVAAMVVIHDHWSSKQATETQSQNPGQHGYAKQSNAVSFEPLIVKILEEGDFWHALTDGSATLNNLTVNNKKGFQILATAGRGIFEPQPELKNPEGQVIRPQLANRLGALTTKTEEGVVVPVLSPWYVLADAYKGKRAAVAASSTEGAAWESSTSAMIDVFLRGEQANGTWRFKNPRLRGVSVALVDFLTARVAAHKAAGDLYAWSHTELPADLRDVLTGPVFAGAADLVLSLVATPAAREAIEKLNAYLCSEAGAPDAFVTALTGAGDLIQLLLDDENLVPILHVAGKALHPDFGRERHPEYSLMDAQLEFLRKARAADEDNALARLLGYAFTELPGGTRTAVGQVVDSISAVQRVDPLADDAKPMSAEDYVSAFRAVSDFLMNERRGFLRFVTIVKERNVRD